MPPTEEELSGPFQIAFSGPVGQLDGDAEIAVVFSRPLRALGVSDIPPPPIELHPPVSGAWEWVGGRALRFAPAQRLPGGTRFSVKVPEGIRDLSGQSLETAHRWEFTTAPPKLLSHQPADWESPVEPSRRIELVFDQAVDLSSVTKGLAITASIPAEDPSKPSRTESIVVDLKANTTGETIRVTPRAPLPAGAEIQVKLDATVAVGGESPAEGREFSFETQGPFRALTIECLASSGTIRKEDAELSPAKGVACAPDGGVRVVLNQQVDAELLAPFVEVSPRVAGLSVTQEWRSRPAVRVHGEFESGKSYKVRLVKKRAKELLLSNDGEPLASEFNATVAFGDHTPKGELNVWGTFTGVSSSLAVPVTRLNVKGAVVFAAPLTREMIQNQVAGRPSGALWGTGRKLGDPPRNRSVTTQENVETLLGTQKLAGPVAVRLQYESGDASLVETREIQFSNMAVIADASHREVHVWVADRTTGAPVVDAEVELRTGLATTGVSTKTDATGRASVSLGEPVARHSPARADKQILFVKKGDDVNYQVMGDRQEDGGPSGLVFTDRGLYRPGESVWLKGIVRMPTDDGFATPVDLPLTFNVLGPKGAVLTTLTARTSKFGTFHLRYTLPLEAPLGLYVLEQKGVRYGSLRTRFTVADYHPAEFAVKAETSPGTLIRGDKLTCSGRGTYLSGGPMGGTSATLSLRRSKGYFYPTGWNKYSWAADGPRQNVDETFVSRPIALDKDGFGSITETLTLPSLSGPESVTCIAAISDLNNKALTSDTSVTVHPGEFYIGVNTEGFELGKPFAPEVIAVTPDGAQVKPEIGLELQLRTAGEQETEPTTIARCTQKDGAPACSFVVTETDLKKDSKQIYLLATARDARGNQISSGDFASLKRKQPEPVAPPPPPAVPARFLEITRPPETLQIGEEASFHVRSPFTANAQLRVLIAREDVVVQQMLELPPDGTNIRFTVTDKMVPEVSVHVTAVLGADAHQAGTDAQVSAEPKRLSVALEASKAKAGPGEEVELSLLVKDAEGNPVAGEVTLWGVDEGTLMLAMYSVPEVLGRVLTTNGYGLREFDTRRRPLVLGGSERNPPSVRMGATSTSGYAPRGDFRQSVLFEPSLATGPDGRLQHKVRLPDSLTTYRFFAVVATEKDSFGRAETAIQTLRPLMARPSLPGVVRVGDRFETTVVLSTTGLPKAETTVQIEASGVTVLGQATRTISLDPTVPARVRFELSAREPGPYSVTVTAKTNDIIGAEDSFVARGKVELPVFLETSLVHGSTSRPVAEAIGDLTGIRKDVGGLTVSMAGSPIATAERGLDSLLHYPYGCTEQTLGRLLPLVVLRDIAKELQVDLGEDPAALAKASMSKLVTHQRPDGGFGLWSGSRKSAPWLTAYAVIVLREAQTRGLAVPENVLAPATDYLVRLLTEGDVHPDGAAAMIDALAGAGVPVAEHATKLVERKDELSPAGRAFLLHALAVANAPMHQRTAIADSLVQSLRLAGSAARAVASSSQRNGIERQLESVARASALTLRALSAHDPSHALLAPLAKGLVDDRVGGTWASTHDTGWALLALATYQKQAASKAFDARVFLGTDLLSDREFGRGSGGHAQVKVPMAQLFGLPDAQKRITFDVLDGGTLHYEMRLDYARETLPSEATDHGLVVERTAVRRAGAVGELQEGEVVRVDLRVASAIARFGVAVESPLPGGLAALAPELLDAVPDVGFPEVDNDKRAWDGRELRADRVLFFVDELPAGVSTLSFFARALHPGDFVLPPTRAFEMYAPEVRGATATERLTVLSRVVTSPAD